MAPPTMAIRKGLADCPLVELFPFIFLIIIRFRISHAYNENNYSGSTQ